MDLDESSRAMLDRAGEQADAIAALVWRLVQRPQSGQSCHALATASDAECQALQSLIEQNHPTFATCEQAALHLARLERMLMLSVEMCAESCRALADRLAVIEEREAQPRHGALTAQRAARLAQRLARLS